MRVRAPGREARGRGLARGGEGRRLTTSAGSRQPRNTWEGVVGGKACQLPQPIAGLSGSNAVRRGVLERCLQRRG